MPKVSIITPAYNMARFLPEAIESALAQDYADKEIVILDDGSKDDTAEVVRRYGDSVQYHWQPNAGVANSYNRLVRLAAGEFIHVLDADDVLLPGAVSRLAGMLDAHPDAGIAYGEATVIDEHGTPYGRRSAPRWIAKAGLAPSRRAFRELLKGCHITNSTVMMRRSALEEVGEFQVESVPGEDWDMWLRIAVGHDLAYVAEPLCLYRTHGASITSGYTIEKVLRSHTYSLDRIFGAPDFPYRDMRGYAYACLYRTVAVVAARGRYRGEFARNFLKSLRLSPGVLRDKETASAAFEGAKTLLPKGFIAAGRSIRRGLFKRAGANG
jgi:glycosyltransferase involved in cell wall biosynthesis